MKGQEFFGVKFLRNCNFKFELIRWYVTKIYFKSYDFHFVLANLLSKLKQF